MEITVTRTGKKFSIASSEYLVMFPDGTTTTLWSPPWNEFSAEEEDAEALRQAEMLWNGGKKKTLKHFAGR